VTTRSRARTAEAPIIDAGDEKRVVEALIFVADEPITLAQLGQVIGHRTPEELRALVAEVERELEAGGHGLRIETVAGGYRLSTCPDLAPWVRTFFRHRNRTRLSPASIETLAVIAYKQPVTAPEIQEIRGVDPQGSLKTLLEKRLVRMAGKKKVIGRPFLYATTREFLVHFGLASIEDLPPIEDFERLASRIEAASEAEGMESPLGDDGPEGEGGAEAAGTARAASPDPWGEPDDDDDEDDEDDSEEE